MTRRDEAQVAVVTVARGRADHLERQARAVAALDRTPCEYVVVSLDERPARDVPGATVIHRPIAAAAPMPLAAARNLAISHVEHADLVLCLDVDCLPEPGSLRSLVDAACALDGDGLLAGPVGRLPPLRSRTISAAVLEQSRAQATAGSRPVPPDGTRLEEPRVELFWALAFAVTPSTHARIGGFDEEYVGYGAEDTDYAFRARRAGVPLVWVGGAWCHHQHHPVSSPPTEHLVDIVANAHRFRRRWGCWPMEGWLREFAARGLVEWAPESDLLRLLQAPGITRRRST